MVKRIKLRAHHLKVDSLTGVIDSPNPQTTGMYGQRMSEHRGNLSVLIQENPDLEIEIIADFDEVCSACPKSPKGPKYICPLDDVFPDDDQRSARYWQIHSNGYWRKKCNALEQTEEDRKISVEHFGLSIGTVILARQASEIARIYNRYMGDFMNFLVESEEETLRKCHVELKAYYEQEGIKQCLH